MTDHEAYRVNQVRWLAWRRQFKRRQRRFWYWVALVLLSPLWLWLVYWLILFLVALRAR